MGTRIETDYYYFVLHEEIPPERLEEVTRKLEQQYGKPEHPLPNGKKKLVIVD